MNYKRVWKMMFIIQINNNNNSDNNKKFIKMMRLDITKVLQAIIEEEIYVLKFIFYNIFSHY